MLDPTNVDLVVRSNGRLRPLFGRVVNGHAASLRIVFMSTFPPGKTEAGSTDSTLPRAANIEARWPRDGTSSKRVVKFRVAKAAKDAILAAK